MLPSRSLHPTNHIGTDCSACCPRGPYLPLTTAEPTAQHVAVAVPISYQPSWSLLPTNHFGTDCSAGCPRGPYLPPTTSDPTVQHVALAVPISLQPLRNRLLSMLPSRSLLPTNHFGPDCSACCRRGPYFPPTTTVPTAQHVAVAVPISYQPSCSLFPSNHFGTECSACCPRGPYFPPTTTEPSAQHVALAVPTSHEPLRNTVFSMLPSRSLHPTNQFGTDCSACCPRGPYLPLTTAEPTAQHVAVAVPISYQPSWSLLPTNHFGTYLSALPSRSLFTTNHFGTNCSACCCRGPYFLPTVVVPTSHQPLRNLLISIAVTVPIYH